MRPVLIHKSHEQRKRISQASSDLQRVSSEMSPFKRHFSCSSLDAINHALTEGSGKKAKMPGKLHPLQRRWSSLEKRSVSRTMMDYKADLNPTNFVWVGVIVAAVITAVVMVSVVCRYYFLT